MESLKNIRFIITIYLITITIPILGISCSTEFDIDYQYQILQQKISDTEGNFTGILDNYDRFGCSIANIGDLNNDGINDIAVGAPWDDDGDLDTGAVWILFLNTDGTVKAHQKISPTQGNFTGTLHVYDYFGNTIANIGDLNNDGINDIAVGAYFDNNDTTAGYYIGAVWILFLNSDGTVKSHQKIDTTEGNFTGILDDDMFGASIANIGDLDKDGINDIVVGSPRDDDGGDNKGAVWILFMNTNGTVKNHQKISTTEGNFTNNLLVYTFGYSIANIGDLNCDSINDIAVGTEGNGILILFLNNNGTVKGHQKIDSTNGNFTRILDVGDGFGCSVANIGDLDNDGIDDIAVGADRDDAGGSGKGAVWILFMNTNGIVKTHQKISATNGNFSGILDGLDYFGSSIANIGYLNKDGVIEIAIGARLYDGGGTDRGAIWILSITSNGTVGP